MYTRLCCEILKTGEMMEIGVVRAPAPEWRSRLETFLSHKKPAFWLAQVAEALDGPLDDLESRFYVGQIDSRLVAQIMVTGSRGAGLLSHVYTLPTDRRKGAAHFLMQALVADGKKSGFRAIGLETTYDSPAYWIYHGIGFRSISDGNGCMIWAADSNAVEELFQPGPATIRDLRWEDWAFFNLLAAEPVALADDLPRSMLLGLEGQGDLEAAFIEFQFRRRQDPLIQARSLVSKAGATVGWALLGPSPLPGAWWLDLHAHSSFKDHLPALVDSLVLPGTLVLCCAAGPASPRTLALRPAGFKPMSELPPTLDPAVYAGRFVLGRG